ncbi:MAG: efflux RND transporter periplasmic adaptor subunit [Betaproteobacteria bacterium]|nr:efflux RND transporter periplasmic adaptor subunit [Betaproteobacteria bacterium]
MQAPATAAKSERKILYYRNPMGLPDTSPVPKKAPDGMDYVPVYADEEASASAGSAKGKILYYRNPMGLPDTSPVPKKDAMGMDYVPVYEGEEPAGPQVKISLDKVQKLGVKTEAAMLREITRAVRAVGTLQVNERVLHTVTTKFEGWIQKLVVNTTGEYVRRGQPLMEVYSPELITAQQEYIVATKGMQALKDASPDMQANMRTLMEGSVQRLRNWDISEQELERLKKEAQPTNSITLHSPVSGVVLEKPSLKGMRFMPGEMLYSIADLSSLWMLADVFEQDLGWVRLGQVVKIRVSAYPERVFSGKVAFIYPTITPETRTAKVRIELANPGGLLKPEMYASVEVVAGQGGKRRVTVPDSAVLDSGTRQLVLVQRGEGLFEPRDVKLGAQGGGYVEVLEGVKEGESVVVSANFLIDAESNLKAALGSFGGPAQGDTGSTPAAPATTGNGARAAGKAPASTSPATPAPPAGAAAQKGH